MTRPEEPFPAPLETHGSEAVALAPDSHILMPEPPAPVFEPTVAEGNPDVARRWQSRANALTMARLAGSAALTYYVAKSNYPPKSWLPTATAAVVAGTDYLDGWCARQGQARGGGRSAFGAYADQLTDKVLANGLQAALAYANGRQSNAITARLFKGATAVTACRDVGVTTMRALTDVAKAPANTDAKKAGKVKAVIQFVGLIAAMSPLAKNKAFKNASTAVVLASACLSAKSGVDYARTYTDALCNRPSRTLIAAPTEG